MLSEIGSCFWINPEDIQEGTLGTPEDLGYSGNDYVWMSTGRSATALVLDEIEVRNPDIRKTAVIPPFTCHTVIEPFLERGYELHTYHVDKYLIACGEDILKTVKDCKAGVVLIHRYFGINTIPKFETIILELKSLDAVVIEDCTQTMYSSFKKADADYYVGSIRKWCGVPDGGFAVCKEGTFENKPSSYDKKLENLKKIASLEKFKFLFERKGDKQVFLNHYQEAEDILDNQDKYYTISNLSSNIQSNLDIENMKYARRRNFKTISKGLENVPNIELVIKDLKEDEVPLYCPILCKKRTEILTLLVRNAIYAPIVWPKADCCPVVDRDSSYIYEHILCIPVDQRYDMDDMKRVVKVFKK